MARYMASGATASALGASTTVPIFNLVSAAAAGFQLRAVRLGLQGGTAAAQVGVSFQRVTARGTASTTVTGSAEDPSAPASAITGVDTAWSGNPTISSTLLIRPSFDILSESLLQFEAPYDEIRCLVGTANGIAMLQPVTSLGSGVLITWTVWWDE